MATRILILTLILTLFATFLRSQSTPCPTGKGGSKFCDSINEMCRVDAYYLTMMAVSKPTSQWYDSIRYPQELLFNFAEGMRALYNGLADTLADFRTYHYQYHPLSSPWHPDSTALVEIYLPLYADPDFKDAGWERNDRVDSLLTAVGMEFVRRDAYASLATGLTYKCPPMVNRAWVERQLKKIYPEITLSPVYKYSPWTHIIEMSEGPDSYEVTLQETSKCLPPELPCSYFRRTFTYQQEWPLRYTKFEQGTIPWPAIREDE